MTTQTADTVDSATNPLDVPVLCKYRPRPYQSEAMAALTADRLAGHQATIVRLPTGMGKTVIMAFLAQALTGRVLILAHREELLDQAAEKCMEVSPERSVGIVQADRNQAGADTVIASIATLAGSPSRCDQVLFAGGFDLVIVDECHHAVAASYLAVLKRVGAYVDPNQTVNGEPVKASVPLVGFTATPYRGDQVGLGHLWEKISYERSKAYGIEHGFITPEITHPIYVPSLRLDGVRTGADGDYSDVAVGRALMNANAPRIAVRKWLAQARKADGTWRRTVAFTPTTVAAYALADAFMAESITCLVITGDTKRKDRQAAYEAVRRGEITVLINCMVLTEGFDLPEIECVLMLRPTKNPSLRDQCIGRGTRPCAAIGKTDCLVLIVTEATTEATPRDLSRKGKVTSEYDAITCGAERAIQAASKEKGEPTPEGKVTYKIKGSPLASGWWNVTVLRITAEAITEVASRQVPGKTDIERAGRLMVQIDKIQRKA